MEYQLKIFLGNKTHISQSLVCVVNLSLTDRFKQLHPHELYLIGVTGNVVEPKNALIYEENHSGFCYNVHNDVP